MKLKDGHAYYYKKIFIFGKLTLFGETFVSSKNRKGFRFWMYLRKFPIKKVLPDKLQ